MGKNTFISHTMCGVHLLYIIHFKGEDDTHIECTCYISFISKGQMTFTSLRCYLHLQINRRSECHGALGWMGLERYGSPVHVEPFTCNSCERMCLYVELGCASAA